MDMRQLCPLLIFCLAHPPFPSLTRKAHDQCDQSTQDSREIKKMKRFARNSGRDPRTSRTLSAPRLHRNLESSQRIRTMEKRLLHPLLMSFTFNFSFMDVRERKKSLHRYQKRKTELAWPWFPLIFRPKQQI